MDPRIRTLRSCADYLSGPHGGDREIDCLESSVHAALELISERLAGRGAPMPKGYKDACDKLAAAGLCDADLAQRLKEVFDIAERARTAWSTLQPGDLDKARREGARALLDLVDALESAAVPSYP